MLPIISLIKRLVVVPSKWWWAKGIEVGLAYGRDMAANTDMFSIPFDIVSELQWKKGVIISIFYLQTKHSIDKALSSQRSGSIEATLGGAVSLFHSLSHTVFLYHRLFLYLLFPFLFSYWLTWPFFYSLCISYYLRPAYSFINISHCDLPWDWLLHFFLKFYLTCSLCPASIIKKCHGIHIFQFQLMSTRVSFTQINFGAQLHHVLC